MKYREQDAKLHVNSMKSQIDITKVNSFYLQALGSQLQYWAKDIEEELKRREMATVIKGLDSNEDWAGEAP